MNSIRFSTPYIAAFRLESQSQDDGGAARGAHDEIGHALLSVGTRAGGCVYIMASVGGTQKTTLGYFRSYSADLRHKLCHGIYGFRMASESPAALSSKGERGPILEAAACTSNSLMIAPEA